MLLGALQKKYESNGYKYSSRTQSEVENFHSFISSAADITEETNHDDVMGLTTNPYGNANMSYAYDKEMASQSTPYHQVKTYEPNAPVETDYLVKFKQMINEMYEKVKNGETEPTFQIGGRAFTLEEWEEFLENFDSIEAAVRELMREAQEERKEELEEQKAVQTEILQEKFEQSSLLVAETTRCTYPSADEEKEDTMYITWYTQDGIFCRKAGQTQGYEWMIIFEDSTQYDNVMNFLEQFPKEANLRFAAHENFWQDFLSGELDIEGFMNFYATTNNGVPDYAVRVGDSMYIDREKAAYAKYMNSFDVHLYTAEEMWQMRLLAIEANIEAKNGGHK